MSTFSYKDNVQRNLFRFSMGPLYLSHAYQCIFPYVKILFTVALVTVITFRFKL